MTLNMNFARMMTNDRYFVQHNILEPKNPPKKKLKKKKQEEEEEEKNHVGLNVHFGKLLSMFGF